MKKQIRILALVVALAMAAFSLAGCGTGAAPSETASTSVTSVSDSSASASDIGTATSAETEQYPFKKLTIICPSDAGGAMDQNCRFIAPYLQEYLGADVEVVNMGGSGGWIGWSYLNDSTADGSIISYANFPNMINGYLNPQNSVGLDNTDFEFLALFTADTNGMLMKAGETRFSNLKEFFEYAKNNPVTIADAGATTDDAVAVAMLEKELGFEFKRVHFQNSAEGLAAILSGNVDAWMGNVSEMITNTKDGKLVPLGIIDKERNANFPDTQCTYEIGVNVASSSSRGFIANINIDSKVEKIILAALKETFEDADMLAAADSVGINVAPIYGDDFKVWAADQTDDIGSIYDMLDT
ncbi:MAG: Bug family tripartite tricarboxylate transporter substrate binding protein [Oscillospiraceae bacterium]